MAIPDWELKKEVMRIVLDFPSQSDVVIEKFAKEVEESFFDESGFTFDNLLDHYENRWHLERFNARRNSKYRRFFSELSFILSTNESVKGTALREASIVEFIQSLPALSKIKLQTAQKEKHSIEEQYRQQLCNALNEVNGNKSTKPIVSRSYKQDSFNCFPIWTGLSMNPLRLVTNGLDAKRIDQSLYYQHPESVARWYKITNDPWYSGHDNCKGTLHDLTNDEEWNKFIDQPDFEGIVMLAGGGVPEKDITILKSLFRDDRSQSARQEPFKYTIVDTSYFMLAESHQRIEKSITDPKKRNRLEIRSIVADMMDLTHQREFLRGKDGNVAWFITGGTIGNVDENDFFASIASQARKGDWLVVGAACIAGEVNQHFIDSFISEYEDLVPQLVDIPLMTALSELGLHDMASSALDDIKIEVLTGENNNRTPVANTATLVGTIELGGAGEIMLVKTSRYKKEDLSNLASQHHWEEKKCFCEQNNKFQQIVFEYNP